MPKCSLPRARSTLVAVLVVVAVSFSVQSASAAGPALVSVACPSASECVAVGEGGRELSFDPATHHVLALMTLAGGHDLASVACPSAAQCTAVDGYGESLYAGGDEVTFNPLASGSAGVVTISPGSVREGTRLPDVACPSVSECVADREGPPPGGRALSFNPLSPGTPANTPVGLRGLQSMDCASVAQCTFVDYYDRTEVTIDPQSGAKLSAAGIDTAGYLSDVACPALSECVAVDTAGHEVTFNPTSPGTRSLVKVDHAPCRPINDYSCELTSVACPSATQCTAVDIAGRAVTFDPNSPRTPIVTTVAERKLLRDVACPSVSECVAVGAISQPVTFDPRSRVARNGRHAIR